MTTVAIPNTCSAQDERMRELHATHGRALLAFLQQLTLGDRYLAEDLLQETLVRAWRNLDSLARDVGALRPWLFTVARRIAIDSMRARRARPAEAGPVDDRIAPGYDGDIDQLLTAHDIKRALSALRAEHRAVIVEIYYYGRTAAEVSVRLGIPEGTVKSRAFYALRALRSEVDRPTATV